jgi:riboflavin synthase
VTRYLAPKGSIAIDGISLTVVDPEKDTFSVAVIPVTIKNTTLALRKAGDSVNMEADVIGKHVRHFMKNDAKSGVTADLLARNGFI